MKASGRFIWQKISRAWDLFIIGNKLIIRQKSLLHSFRRWLNVLRNFWTMFITISKLKDSLCHRLRLSRKWKILSRFWKLFISHWKCAKAPEWTESLKRQKEKLTVLKQRWRCWEKRKYSYRRLGLRICLSFCKRSTSSVARDYLLVTSFSCGKWIKSVADHISSNSSVNLNSPPANIKVSNVSSINHWTWVKFNTLSETFSKTISSWRDIDKSMRQTTRPLMNWFFVIYITKELSNTIISIRFDSGRMKYFWMITRFS